MNAQCSHVYLADNRTTLKEEIDWKSPWCETFSVQYNRPGGTYGDSGDSLLADTNIPILLQISSTILYIVMFPHYLKIFRRECTTSPLANQIFLLCRSYFLFFYSRESRTSWLNRSWRCAKYLLFTHLTSFWQQIRSATTVLWVATASALAGTSYYTA